MDYSIYLPQQYLYKPKIKTLIKYITIVTIPTKPIFMLCETLFWIPVEAQVGLGYIEPRVAGVGLIPASVPPRRSQGSNLTEKCFNLPSLLSSISCSCMSEDRSFAVQTNGC